MKLNALINMVTIDNSISIFLLAILTLSQASGYLIVPSGDDQYGQLSSSANKVSLGQLLPEIQDVEFENTPVTNEDHSNDDYQQSCQLVQIVHLLKHVGCQSKAIASFACTGSCPSYIQMSSSKFWQHERSCSCCQQTGLKEATFTLDCPALDPPYRRVKTYAPVDCMCRACTDLGKESLQPQELVDALGSDTKGKI